MTAEEKPLWMSEELAEALRQYNAEVLEPFERMMPALFDSGQILSAISAVITPQLDKALDELRKLASAEVLKGFGGAFAAAMAPNWPTEPDDPSVGDILDWTRDTRWSIVWVPRSEVVMELVKADSAERREAVLLERGPDIAQDCRLVLDEIESERVVGLAVFGQEVVGSLVDGRYAAAQALASVIITDLLHTKFGWVSFGDARRALHPPPDDVPLWMGRILMVLSCLADFLDGHFPGQPVPNKPNRHASAHRADPTQYNRRNALLTTLLLVGLLREIDELDRRGLWEQFLADGIGVAWQEAASA